MGTIYIRRWREYLITRGGEGRWGGILEGVGWVGGSVRFNPRRTMRDQGGREGNASDDALLKTWLTSVNKMDARDVHCYGRWLRPWFRCLVPPVQSSPTTLPSSPSIFYEPLWVSMSRRSDRRARFVCPQISFFLRAIRRSLTPLRTGGHGPLSSRKEIETARGGKRKTWSFVSSKN